jgi:predicted RecB family nuclease
MPKKPTAKKTLPPLTAQDFFKYAKCPNWVYWDLFGDADLKGEVPEMIKRLREDGVLHEKEVMKGFGPYEEVKAKGTNEALAALTLELMKTGATIYQGVLMDGDWVGRPDILRPMPSPSKLGAWTYEAVEIKSSREISDIQMRQLVFYALLLKKVQGVMPEEGRIINVDRVERSFRIDEAEADFFDALDRILAIRAGEKPEALFTSACKDSPWYATCRKEAEKNDDISLIYKLYKKEYRKLREAGYDTLTKLANAPFDDLLRDVHGISEARLERLHLQAESLHMKKIIRVSDPGLGAEPTELFFDIEGDPMGGVEYLFGLLIREDGKERYQAFVAEGEGDPHVREGRAWAAFCDFMEGYAGTTIYHYGWYERDVIRRLSAKHGISKKAAEALDASCMIDLLKVVQPSVIFPLYFYSLKDLAKHLGFRWRASDASGANSVLWYQAWQEKGDMKMLRKIVDYNEDDVIATRHLKDWLVKGE